LEVLRNLKRISKRIGSICKRFKLLGGYEGNLLMLQGFKLHQNNILAAFLKEISNYTKRMDREIHLRGFPRGTLTGDR
jgi:hypothetical protein